jgi:hypothetical protein
VSVLSPDEVRVAELQERIAEIDALDAEQNSRAERRLAAEQNLEAAEDKIRANKRQALVDLKTTSDEAILAQDAFVASLADFLAVAAEAKQTMHTAQNAISAARTLGVLSGPPALERLLTRARNDSALDKNITALRNILVGM